MVQETVWKRTPMLDGALVSSSIQSIHFRLAPFEDTQIGGEFSTSGLFEEQRIRRALLLTEAIIGRLLDYRSHGKKPANNPGGCHGMSWDVGVPQIIQNSQHFFKPLFLGGTPQAKKSPHPKSPQLEFKKLLVQSLELQEILNNPKIDGSKMVQAAT